MILPQVSAEYSVFVERERNRTLEFADQQNRKVSSDVELTDERLILRSPDGTRWSIEVSNAGAISATSL